MKPLKIAVPALLALLMLAPPARASTAVTGEGSFTSTVTITSVRQADGNTFVTGIEVQTLTGALVGTRIAEGVEVIHPDGTFNANDTGTFTGTIAGRTGTVVITGSSTGVGASGSGQLVVDRGTLGLAALHGQGTFEPTITGPTTAAGTYSLEFLFTP